MQITAAKILSRYFLARGCFDQWWARQENRALLLDDDIFITHRRNIRPARRARTHHRRDLRNATARQIRRVVENSAEVVTVRKDIRLVEQHRPARINEVDTRQVVVGGDLLGAEMLLHRHRVIRATRNSRVIGHHETLPAFHQPNACNDTRCGDLALVHVMRSQRRDLQKRRARIEQLINTLPWQDLATRRMAFTRLFRATLRCALQHRAEICDHLLVALAVRGW